MAHADSPFPSTRLLIPGLPFRRKRCRQGPDTRLQLNGVEKRVNDLVSQMTLDEKIDLIGGDTPFRTHPVALDLNPQSSSDFDVSAGSWEADAGSYERMLGKSSREDHCYACFR
jgi:hypothetical protein